MQKYSQVEFNQISIGCNLLNFSSILHKAFFWSWIDRKSWKNVASFSVVFSNDKGLSKSLLLFTSKVCFMFYAVILKQIQYFITTTIFSVAWLIDINENANCSTKPQCVNSCFFLSLGFYVYVKSILACRKCYKDCYSWYHDIFRVSYLISRKI